MTCDGRFCNDPVCPSHSEAGRQLTAARIFATHDPDVDWPSVNHTDPVDAILAAFDRVREPVAST